jgi:hypothetical protein
MSLIHFDATTDNYLTDESNNFVLFTGNDDTMSFSACGQSTIVSAGNDQTISVSKVGSCDDNLYLLGNNDSLGFAYLFPQTMLSLADFQVWGFRSGDAVKLIPSESATVKPDGHGGSFLTISTPGFPATNPPIYSSPIHFMNTPTPVLSQAIVHT